MAKEIDNNAFENESRKGAHSCARMGVRQAIKALNTVMRQQKDWLG